MVIERLISRTNTRVEKKGHHLSHTLSS